MKEAATAIEKYQPLWGFWKIEELISRGDGCDVYRVYKEEWGKRYTSILKHMSFTISSSDIREAQAIGIDEAAMPEYFKSVVGGILNEIELMYRLRGNSNILTYEDHAIYPKKGVLGWDVLIRVENLQPLTDFLSCRSLDRNGVIRLGIDICKALEACARENIIHRDIKESSIFVSPKGEFKLGSFSLAKEKEKGGRAAARFSPLYMAPELYMEQSYDASVDIYSLGIVMYKLLNKGRLPFMPLPPESITVEATEASINLRMSGAVPEPPADAGEALGALILKAVSFDKKERFRSPQEFRNKLERLLRSEAKAQKKDSLITDCAAECAAAKEDNEPTVKVEYEKELEKLAFAELMASIEKVNSNKPTERRKNMRYICLCLILMAAAFALAFAAAYEPSPVEAELPAAEASITPTATQSPTPAPALSEEVNAEKPEESKDEKKEAKNQAKPASSVKDNRNEEYFYQLAASHSSQGMQYYAEGRPELSLKEFQTALGALKDMKSSLKKYDIERFSKQENVYSENISRLQEKLQRIEECFKLAAERNKAGMEAYSAGSYYRAKQEFESALDYMKEIRLLVPKYSSNGYEGLQSIYEGNLSRTLEKL